MLGTHLCRRLADSGVKVLALDVADDDTPYGDIPRNIPSGRADITRIRGDVRDPGLVKRLMVAADAVVHCAAALPSYAPSEIWSVDLDGTRTVVNAAQAARIGRLIHVSSTAVYGVPAVIPTPESYARKPIDHYGRAKTEAEVICERAREDGLEVTILRPKTFLGPQRLGLFAMLFEWADEGLNFPLPGGGNVLCQMLDVADLVDAVFSALTGPRDAVNGTFNIAAAEFGTLRDDFQAVLDAAGHGGRIVSIPIAPGVPVLRALSALHISPVYKRLTLKLLADSYVDVSKAQARLGFQPRYSNRDSLLRTYEWWRHARESGPAWETGRTHRSRWRQGALRAAKAFCRASGRTESKVSCHC